MRQKQAITCRARGDKRVQPLHCALLRGSLLTWPGREMTGLAPHEGLPVRPGCPVGHCQSKILAWRLAVA
jgi:putative transposase